MGILDRFRRAKPPASAPRREPVVRSYAAASNTVRLADMSSSVGSADSELIASLSKLRNRARLLAMNSSVMQRFILLMQDNVVGENGFHLRSRVRKADGSLDSGLNQRVQDAFWRWTENGMTVDGGLGWVEFWRLVVESWCRDGEFIAEFVTGRYRDGLALNPIEPDLLDDSLNTIYPQTGNEIRLGVEIDSAGSPVAYHFLTYHPGDSGWFSQRNSNRKYRRVPADKVMHLYIRRRIGQTRGEPPITPVVRDLKMLDGYREAELTNRRISASTMGFITERLSEGASPNSPQAFADEKVGEGASAELVIDMEPGVFRRLPSGLQVEKFEGASTSVDFAQFDGQIKRSLSMGLGISAFSLGMEIDKMSFSTARTIVIEDRDFYRGKQRMFMRLAKKIFDRWLTMHILSDGAQIPASRTVVIQENSVFRARGWAWVDPAKDTSANAEALRTRQTSLSRIASERGLDFDELLDEIEADEAALKERGLTLTFSDGSVKKVTDDDEGDKDV